MKAVIAGVTALVLGMVGLVAFHQSQKQPVTAPEPAVGEAVPAIVTISTGDQVDIVAHVPRNGVTIVEFTAEF